MTEAPAAALLFALALLPSTGSRAPAQEPQASAPGRAFEIADYFRTAMVGTPVVSRDGRRVAFTVGRYELEAGESWSEIWMMAPDGSELRQMTFGRHKDTSPAFSPDGRALLFVSDRSGESQLFRMPVDGGEARKLTDFPGGVSGPVWSPDGRRVAVTASVYPECGGDPACNRDLAKDDDQGKLDVHVTDSLLYRHWTSWRDGRYAHVLLIDAEKGEMVRDLTPGAWDSPVFSLGGEPGYAFSPRGDRLCFVSNREADQAGTTNADLWLVSLDGDAAGEEPVNVTRSNHGWDGAPVFSPDGGHLAFLSQATPGYESDLKRLALLDMGTLEVRYLTDRASFDDMIDAVRWSPDGSQIYFTAARHGRTPIFRIPAAGGAVQEVHTDATITGFELVDDSGSILYTRRAVGAPPEMQRVPAAGGRPVRLTHFNAALEEEVDIRPAEELWVKGDGDYQVQVFVVKPHGFDPHQRYPLILNVHGGPQSEWTDAYRGDWQVYPGKGYVVAFANPTGSTGYGQDFTDAIACDWGGRVFRDLMKVTDALAELPYVDPERMGSMGWSYGGYMMMWFQGHTDRFKCQAAMMGLFDLNAFYGATEELWFPKKDLCGVPWESEQYERWSPSRFVRNFKTPALVITGEQDFRVPYTQGLGYFTALQERGVPSRLVVFPKAGHWPSWQEMAFYYNAHLDWFHRWLGGEAAPYDVVEHARNRAFKPHEEGKG
jgi:dipeptidyl aminopeptidase/acylaminoacyl peptidase